MDVEFPQISVIDPQQWGIAFPVIVDGLKRRCLIEDEAIQDMFNVKTADLEELKRVFDENRHLVEAHVRTRLVPGEDGEIRIYKENV